MRERLILFSLLLYELLLFLRKKEEEDSNSNLVFYAQSTITVISGIYKFCRYTISVKNMSMLKTYMYSDF